MVCAMIGFGTETPGSVASKVRASIVLVVIGGMLLSHALLRKRHIEDTLAAMSPWLRGAIVGWMIFFIAVAAGGQRAFIYFQF